LGAGILDNGSDVPVPVQGLTAGVTAVAAGGSNSCAVMNGAVYCWGYNYSSKATLVPGLTDGVTDIECGDWHCCAIKNGSAQCWGEGLANGAEDSSSSAVQVAGLTAGVAEIAASTWSSCALVNGTVMCWGHSYWGILANDQQTPSSPIPVPAVNMPAGVTQISGGDWHYCAVANNAAFCWGRDVFGAVGSSTIYDERRLPADVVFP
jgi:alpha-tubulin suppressor-like RCC1 family protein